MLGPAILCLGNGPSLRDVQLGDFVGVHSIGMNAAYRFWDEIGWQPTYYACADHRLALSHIEFFVASVRAKRFRAMLLPASVLAQAPELSREEDIVFIDQFLPYWYEQLGRAAGLGRLDSPFFVSMRPEFVTTGAVSLRWALTMGYRRLGMLGIDCSYEPLSEWASDTASDIALRIEQPVSRNANYFFDGYQQVGDLFNIPEPGGRSLHLDAIAAVRDDLIAMGSKAKLHVLDPRPMPNREGVVRYCPPSAFLRDVGITFVVVDATGIDSAAVAAIIASWDDPARWPGARLDPLEDRRLVVVIDPEADAGAIERVFADSILLPASFRGLRVVRGGGLGPVLTELAASSVGEALVMRIETRPIRPAWLEDLVSCLGSAAKAGTPVLIDLSASRTGAPSSRTVGPVALAEPGEGATHVRAREPDAIFVANAALDWREPVRAPGAFRSYGNGLRIVDMNGSAGSESWSVSAIDGKTLLFRLVVEGGLVVGDLITVSLLLDASGAALSLVIGDADPMPVSNRALATPNPRGEAMARLSVRTPAANPGLKLNAVVAGRPDATVATLKRLDLRLIRGGGSLGRARIERVD